MKKYFSNIQRKRNQGLNIIFLCFLIFLLALNPLWVDLITSEKSYEHKILRSTQNKSIRKILSSESIEFVSPLDNESFIEILPLGELTPPIHTFPTDHIYYILNDSEGETWNVYAPASGTVFWLYFQQVSDENGTYDDYSIGIRHSSSYISYFYHVANLSGPLSQYSGTMADDSEVFINKPVSKGQIIAKAWVHGSQTNLDWGLENHEIDLPWIHPETYWSGTAYCDCPLYYLTGSNLTDAKAKIKRLNVETDPNWGGEICFDQANTISGNWFSENKSREGYTIYTLHQKEIALVYNNFNASQMVVSIGSNATGACECGVYNATGPRWNTTTMESGLTSYNLTVRQNELIKNYTMLVQLVEPERLKVETFEGHLSNPVFTENATYYDKYAWWYNEDYIAEIMLLLTILSQEQKESSFPMYIFFLIGGCGAIGVILTIIVVKIKTRRIVKNE
ncbi:MAG: hypothetical protein BAJALOKI1v1_900006 [Promethearchaeota archaeon]|nr:MAG: hypothetical protein BAJALOKI1v1_900006 [Candidatus Lokiarchaeota archaeon]